MSSIKNQAQSCFRKLVVKVCLPEGKSSSRVGGLFMRDNPYERARISVGPALYVGRQKGKICSPHMSLLPVFTIKQAWGHVDFGKRSCGKSANVLRRQHVLRVKRVLLLAFMYPKTQRSQPPPLSPLLYRLGVLENPDSVRKEQAWTELYDEWSMPGQARLATNNSPPPLPRPCFRARACVSAVR